MTTSDRTDGAHDASETTPPLLVGAAWLLVGVPLAYGLWQTLVRASALFTG